jgi:DNA-binding MarR family transcriptional regulator
MSDSIDTRYLENLLGYNTRRATLVIVADFMEQMQPYELSTVEFSVLSLIRHNPGITSRQICTA